MSKSKLPCLRGVKSSAKLNQLLTSTGIAAVDVLLGNLQFFASFFHVSCFFQCFFHMIFYIFLWLYRRWNTCWNHLRHRLVTFLLFNCKFGRTFCRSFQEDEELHGFSNCFADCFAAEGVVCSHDVFATLNSKSENYFEVGIEKQILFFT